MATAAVVVGGVVALTAAVPEGTMVSGAAVAGSGRAGGETRHLLRLAVLGGNGRGSAEANMSADESLAGHRALGGRLGIHSVLAERKGAAGGEWGAQNGTCTRVTLQ